MRPAPSPRHLFVGLIVALTVIAAVLIARGGATELTVTGPTPIREHPNIGPFQGLGAWVDLYDRGAWKDPASAVAGMASHGVRTLYLQTSNDSRAAAFVDPGAVAGFLDAASARGIGVVAWYFAGFKDLRTDTARAEAAIHFTTPAGHRFAGFALDIESPAVSDPQLRTRRLLELSVALRTDAGPGYPLGAIVPSPLGLAAHHGYWPGFPWPQIAQIYDTILPMSYFTWGPRGQTGAYENIVGCVRLVRRWVGNDLVPIHEIGGLSEHATPQETRGFVDAVRDTGSIGGSYYSWTGMTSAQWSELADVRTNPVGIPPLPVRAGTQALGNIPGADTTHPNAVAYAVIGQAGARSLTFDSFGPDPATVYVDGQRLGAVTPSALGAWEARTMTIPDSMLDDAAPNAVTFVPSDPSSPWGVRDVRLRAA
ncbi:MAG: hypothetical protein L3K06_06270 [Thermoplasmata archaeon]|nr:hypothetical protein [Thermoplasmata archaeon]